MSLFNNVLAGSSGQQGYQISRSVRLRTSAGGYFNRTPSSSGSTTQWTLSTWVKRGTLGTFTSIFSACITGNPYYQSVLAFDSSDRLWYYQFSNSSVYTVNVTSTAVFRDPSAWYHVVMKFDATTSSMIVWVNNQQVINSSSFSTTFRYINTTNTHYIGNYAYQSVGPGVYDGYLAEFNFIDGQALTPSSFGETNTTTGVWQPKKYTGTYGTNGFYLNFSDNSSNTSTTIGKDSSGNGNNWTPNNISVTAGVTYDSMLDTPTPYADGGNGRGNYAVNNPLNVSGGTYADGNLTWTSPATDQKSALSTIPVTTTGNWYCEVTIGSKTGSYWSVGVLDIGTAWSLRAQYRSDGATNVNGTGGSTWASYTTNDVIGISYNSSTGVATFYKNNTSQGSLTVSSQSTTQFFGCSSDSSGGTSTYYVNHGQRPFAYTPPTGFKALNTLNLPSGTIVNGAQYMAATLYTGNGSSQSISNGANNTLGITFQPDLLIQKSRSAATDNIVYDTNRGANYLVTNSTAAEVSSGIIALTSTGFNVGSGTAVNANAATYVGWQWKAAGSTVSNTAGSITSSVSAGTSQGFSVVTYTGTGVNATVGHGLGVAPSMMIFKNRSSAVEWQVYHASVGNTQYGVLNSTAAFAVSGIWQNTSPTSSVFSIGNFSGVNTSGANYVAYLFAEVAGFSKFGSYTGNGSADGPFVYLGFRPRWMMVKRTDTITSPSWLIYDTSRVGYNGGNSGLFAESSIAESATSVFDIVSNGFKARNADGTLNGSGGTYIYAAFAENPFKYALAR